MLSHEETRRRVSIDFTLSDELLEDLRIEDGVVVPISLLTKEPRKKFDLRDESGRAIPVLGRNQNGDLAHIALLNAALDALPEDTSAEVFEMLAADLRQIVFGSREQAADALGFFMGSAEAGDPLRAAILDDGTCQVLLAALWANYVLFAVLAPGGPNRRVLKLSYADDFDLTPPSVSVWKRLAPAELWGRASRPDHKEFVVECAGAWSAASFHAEIAIPEELEVRFGMLYDFASEQPLSRSEENVNRLSVYATNDISADAETAVFLQVAAQRAGRPVQAAITSVVVAGLLWLGVTSGLDATNPGAAVSTLLAGAALFTGVSAVQGEHRLVRTVFRASRRWLTLVALVALTAAACLAMEWPCARPVILWRVCAIVVSVAAARLVWSAVRAPS